MAENGGRAGCRGIERDLLAQVAKNLDVDAFDLEAALILDRSVRAEDRRPLAARCE